MLRPSSCLLALLLASATVACGAPTRTNVVRYPSGELKWEVEVVSNVPHGESRTYHPNGRLKTKGRYVRGQRHGEFAYFDEDGRLTRLEVYEDGELRWSGNGATVRAPTELASIIRPALSPELDTDAAPVFATLDRVASTSQVGTHLALLRWARVGGSNGGRQLEMFGQWMARHWGAYGVLSSRSARTADDASLDGKVVLELGGARRFDALGQLFVGTAGMAVPLANDDLDGFSATTATMSSRLGDAVLTLPRSTALRASLSMIGASRFIFYRIDAGLDFAFDIARATDAVRMHDRSAALARLSIGGGLAGRYAIITGELVNVGLLTGGPGESLMHSVAVSVRLRRWSVEPYVAAVAPLLSGDTVTAVGFLFGARYSGATP